MTNNTNNNNNTNFTSFNMNSYPGMVNNVCNIFGMKPEEYNLKLYWLNQQTLQEQYDYQNSQFNNIREKREIVDDTDSNIHYCLKKCKKW